MFGRASMWLMGEWGTGSREETGTVVWERVDANLARVMRGASAKDNIQRTF